MPATLSVSTSRPAGRPHAAGAGWAVRPAPAAHPARPVAAVPAPMRARLARAIVALIDPIDPAPRRPSAPRVACGYAAFEAPTYQRRGLTIAGLEPDDAPAAGSIVTRDASNA